jgi:hypothetical protein
MKKQIIFQAIAWLPFLILLAFKPWIAAGYMVAILLEAISYNILFSSH